MANTYCKIYLHTVFAVKYKKAQIKPKWESKLHSVIGSLINQSEGQSIIVNGTSDHIHCCFYKKPNVSESELMKLVKAKSSKWINESGYTDHRFSWQKGFGCFSFSESHRNHIYRYIKNQKEHHKVLGFREEYLRLLQSYNIEYDEKYIFRELE
ncbi:IS200/IS605 family transposase [Rhodohalobacter sp.]|uniref:IS200/IS605 family transposase n=1 Tax=Rhodohalobacter sp. TaxID=1974210 RepID=UPI002ACD7EBA|nr:IS200/IS605 family transposase [Rhodohalobacter sp.]MDZ7756605.1 IS200/IS605 family transposase [Rhodohalobacter sp.]